MAPKLSSLGLLPGVGPPRLPSAETRQDLVHGHLGPAAASRDPGLRQSRGSARPSLLCALIGQLGAGPAHRRLQRPRAERELRGARLFVELLITEGRKPCFCA
ncbi:Hypothetical predicted protein [Marmota monax]|uniref:Uncharacterized protein n=1 Tax=Marmota monax TaxID=9995 RepID=A0A5E4AYZ6_MARMO|nr:Hypothetical predicted protein [Marmota monax]